VRDVSFAAIATPQSWLELWWPLICDGSSYCRSHAQEES
jgi:hypothetical protein